jgi:uncharacterized protein YbdZ (MbtH family)
MLSCYPTLTHAYCYTVYYFIPSIILLVLKTECNFSLHFSLLYVQCIITYMCVCRPHNCVSLYVLWCVWFYSLRTTPWKAQMLWVTAVWRACCLAEDKQAVTHWISERWTAVLKDSLDLSRNSTPFIKISGLMNVSVRFCLYPFNFSPHICPKRYFLKFRFNIILPHTHN